MAWLVFGATGLFGQAAMAALAARNIDAVGCARRGAEMSADLSRPDEVRAVLNYVKPDAVLNAAAVTSLDACEAEPAFAYAVNAGAVGVMADWCAENKARLIHISTDHFFSGDGDRLHTERFPIMILNQYARTKHDGEALALTAPGALVVRTNITGPRGWAGRPTFAEWAVNSLQSGLPIKLFTDYYTSTMDAKTCVDWTLDAAAAGGAGVLNIAAREATNKWMFVQTLAAAAGLDASEAIEASVADMATPRAESCGLDVRKAEALVGRRLPNLDTVAVNLVTQFGLGGAKAA